MAGTGQGILAWKIPYTNVTLLQLILFTVFLVIGIIIVRIIAKITEKTLRRLEAPDIVVGLVSSLVKAVGYIIVILAVLPTIGISTGAAGLGLSAILAFIIGFGLQDTWANMAAGVWLAVIRPFDKGDYIEVAGYKGVVQGIGVLSTVLKTFDNAIITIPNKAIWGSPMVNYTREPVRRGTISIGVAYGTNLDKAVSIILETVKKHPNVLEDPAPQVVITEF
ncbi:MAG: mechanosensitive ion channel family protein, partial [Desulfurococcales archaeon]|nr:mechanosensitive ion channel family protein [Desulfurococcales archaeon]